MKSLYTSYLKKKKKKKKEKCSLKFTIMKVGEKNEAN